MSQPDMTSYDPNCRYCLRRGEPCRRHGGEPKGLTKAERQKREARHPTPTLPDRPFDNIYNCSLCARKGDLCELHANFHKKRTGQSSIQTAERVEGDHRIVQIKVGQVIITIKEPI